MYYGIVSAAVVLFGLQFYCNQRFEKENGQSLSSAMTFTALSGAAGWIVLLAANGFRWEYTPFTLLMAALTAVSSLLYSFCSMRALHRINLSLYSLFAMLGGMALPFVTGILFYGESLSPGKAVCFVLVAAALLLPVRRGNRRGGAVYYAGVFVLNGLSGVLAQIFTEAPYAKTSAAGMSCWAALLSAVLAGLVLLVTRLRPTRPGPVSLLCAAGGGVLNRVANWLLLIALVHLPASAQYPLVTGGVLIVSTLLSVITRQRPTAREWVAVGLAVAGTVVLVLLPV